MSKKDLDLLSLGSDVYIDFFYIEDEDLAISMNTNVKFDDIEVAKVMIDIEDDIYQLIGLSAASEEIDDVEDRILKNELSLKNAEAIKKKFDEVRSLVLEPEVEILGGIFKKIRSGCAPHSELMIDNFCEKFDYSKQDLKSNQK